jgi:hypothetical protein
MDNFTRILGGFVIRLLPLTLVLLTLPLVATAEGYCNIVNPSENPANGYCDVIVNSIPNSSPGPFYYAPADPAPEPQFIYPIYADSLPPSIAVILLNTQSTAISAFAQFLGSSLDNAANSNTISILPGEFGSIVIPLGSFQLADALQIDTSHPNYTDYIFYVQPVYDQSSWLGNEVILTFRYYPKPIVSTAPSISAPNAALVFSTFNGGSALSQWIENDNQWQQRNFAAPTLTSVAAADANDVFGIVPSTGHLALWQYTTSWKFYDLGAAGGTVGITSISVVNNSFVYAIRADDGSVQQWQYSGGQWQNYHLAGHSFSFIATAGSNFVYGVTIPTSHLGVWQWTSTTGWNYADLGAAGGNVGITSISVPASNFVYAIRADDASLQQWQYSPTGGWSNAQLPGHSFNSIATAGSNIVFGINNANGHLAQWQWQSNTGWQYADLEVGGASIAINALSAPTASTVFGIRSDNGFVQQWQYTGGRWLNSELP